MYLIKKVSLYTIIILLLLSLYNDFRKDSFPQDRHDASIEADEQVAHIKFERGDTLLSISERLNGNHLSEISMEKMIADFEKMNPNADVRALEIGTYYYFPIYEKN